MFLFSTSQRAQNHFAPYVLLLAQFSKYEFSPSKNKMNSWHLFEACCLCLLIISRICDHSLCFVTLHFVVQNLALVSDEQFSDSDMFI